MRTLFHVGMPKSGSTSIQIALARNKKTLLEEHGVYCDRVQPEIPSDFLVYQLAMERRFDELRTLLSGRIDRAKAHGANAVIFSSERCFMLANHDTEFEGMLDAFRAVSDELEVIIVIREVRAFLRSYILQLIHNGGAYLEDRTLAAWTMRSIRRFWALPERVVAVSHRVAVAEGRLFNNFLLAATGQETSLPEEIANVTPQRPLLLSPFLGVVCKFAALQAEKDVNSPEIDEVRSATEEIYDEFMQVHDADGAALRLVNLLSHVLYQQITDYIDDTMSLLAPEDAAFIDRTMLTRTAENSSASVQG